MEIRTCGGAMDFTRATRSLTKQVKHPTPKEDLMQEHGSSRVASSGLK
jgi:hypothetical protein